MAVALVSGRSSRDVCPPRAHTHRRPRARPLDHRLTERHRHAPDHRNPQSDDDERSLFDPTTRQVVESRGDDGRSTMTVAVGRRRLRPPAGRLADRMDERVDERQTTTMMTTSDDKREDGRHAHRHSNSRRRQLRRSSASSRRRHRRRLVSLPIDVETPTNAAKLFECAPSPRMRVKTWRDAPFLFAARLYERVC